MSTQGKPRELLPAWVALGLAPAVAMLWKVAELALPPHGEHAWRDADGLGVARCFLREGFHLLAPRVVERGATTGIVGMELPVVNAAAAASMAVFGRSDLAARAVVWLCLVPLAGFGLALGRRILRDEAGALLGAACLVLQPLVIVFSRKLMPEVPMLAALLGAQVLACDALEQTSTLRALGAGGSFALAAVLKPTGAAAAIPVAVWAIRAFRRARTGARRRVAACAALIALIPTFATAAWFLHARALTARYGVPLFRLHNDWLDWIRLLRDPQFYAIVFGRVFHLYLLWPTVIWMAWRWRTLGEVLRAHLDLAAWVVGAMGMVVLFGSHTYQHEYYALPLLPPLALIAGDFAARASRLQARPAAAQAAFLAIFAATAIVRTLPRFPPVGFDASRLARAMRWIPDPGLAVVTDARSPVVSLVILDRVGWAAKPEALTPAEIAHLTDQGARQLIESSFGGWLPAATRRAMPQPVYADDQVRVYPLGPALLR